MLRKIFGARKLAPTPITTEEQEERSSPALKIIHAGGLVELYYMAVPAARIIEKYPSFLLARPEVFRRPWDAVIGPEEILIPGQKYLVVPSGTVTKLRRRINKPNGNEITNSSMSFTTSSQSSIVAASQKEDGFSKSNPSFIQNRFGILIKSKTRIKNHNRRVRFFGIDTTQDSSLSSEKKRTDGNNSCATRRTRSIIQWQPVLTSISED